MKVEFRESTYVVTTEERAHDGATLGHGETVIDAVVDALEHVGDEAHALHQRLRVARAALEPVLAHAEASDGDERELALGLRELLRELDSAMWLHADDLAGAPELVRAVVAPPAIEAPEALQ